MEPNDPAWSSFAAASASLALGEAVTAGATGSVTCPACGLEPSLFMLTLWSCSLSPIAISNASLDLTRDVPLVECGGFCVMPTTASVSALGDAEFGVAEGLELIGSVCWLVVLSGELDFVMAVVGSAVSSLVGSWTAAAALWLTTAGGILVKSISTGGGVLGFSIAPFTGSSGTMSVGSEPSDESIIISILWRSRR